MENEIASVIKYFAFFAYHPTLEEIYQFLQVKISKGQLQAELDRLKYTPPQYSMRKKISRKKLDNWRYKAYILMLSLFPQIKLIGLSGSISMMNAKEDDDIDLFIITGKNRLFTGRLITLVLAQLLRLRRIRKARYQKDKVCLNLFFDESNLKVPKFKQTEFVGHEVLQMKPVVVKSDMYKSFLMANQWVFKLFPNAQSQINYKGVSHLRRDQSKITLFIIISNKIEQMLKSFQLHLINKHRTTEIITDTQLWFHPDDFEHYLLQDVKRPGCSRFLVRPFPVDPK